MVATIKLELNLDTLIEAINSLDLEEKQKLWLILDWQIQGIKVENSDEVVSIDEIVTSEEAWNNYIAGNDKGISSQELKRKLLNNQSE